MLAVSLAGFAHVLNQSTPPAGGTPEPPPRDEPRHVVALGYVDLEKGVLNVFPVTPGRVEDVFVREGQSVAENAPLLRIQDRAGPPQIAIAQADVDATELQLAEARKQPERHEAQVEQQKLRVAGATEKVKSLRSVLDQMNKLHGTGVGVSAVDIEKARGDLVVAELQSRAEDAALNVPRKQDPLFQARLLQARLVVARAKLDAARAAADAYTITAPAAGTVLRLHVGKGSTLAGSPQQPAIEFGVDGPRIIRAEVEQADAGKVAEGQAVEIRDDTHAGGVWTGRVTHVSDWFTRKRSVLQEPLQFNDVRTLECLIALDPGQPALRINQKVRAVIKTGN